MKWKHISPFFARSLFSCAPFSTVSFFSVFICQFSVSLWNTLWFDHIFLSAHSVRGDYLKWQKRVPSACVDFDSKWMKTATEVCTHSQYTWNESLSRKISLFFFFYFSRFPSFYVFFFFLLMNLLCLNWTRYESLPKSIRSSVLQYFCSCLQFSHGKFPSTAQPKKLHDSYSSFRDRIGSEIKFFCFRQLMAHKI